ncbi:MAG: ABC transporter permease [Bacteroidia bacterium]|nr:ABC transporter permease [Bacteroidia bacterium]
MNELKVLAALLRESLIFAWSSLVMNKLRTFLSLLGITIGIFAIISVFTVIDSLANSVRTSLESLGDNVIYIQKWPWEFGSDYPWWKYMKRPLPKLSELEEIQKRSQKTEAAAFLVNTTKTVQYKNNSATDAPILASTIDYDKIWSFEISEGRYFSPLEAENGVNCAVIGAELADKLFENEDPIGNHIKILGRKIQVIGIFKKQGKSLSRSMDNVVLLPISYARNIIDIRDERVDPFIMVKSKPGISNEEIMDELKGIMRSIHRLKPLAEDDFALNRASLIIKQFERIFGVINIAGMIIGGFAIIVGAFGIANIMFVSVRERTNIIGIQKAIGAKNRFIMFEFLYESVILSLIGGIIGLLLIYIAVLIANSTISMDFSLSLKNIITGIGISVTIGILAGIVPAYIGSRLNPVVAINTNS